MTYTNPPVEPDDLDLPQAEAWHPISPRYKTVLRCVLTLYGLPIAGAPWLPILFAGEVIRPWLPWFSGATVLTLGFLLIIWVPRRVRYTRYLLREKDMHMQSGCWWRKTVSVAINRIQHLEVTQGPLERSLGLSKLVLYTAGGSQSDLRVPGLTTDRARSLKARLTRQTTEEVVPDVAPE